MQALMRPLMQALMQARHIVQNVSEIVASGQ